MTDSGAHPTHSTVEPWGSKMADDLRGAVEARDELVAGIRTAAAALEAAGYAVSASSARATADKWGQ